MIEDVRRLELEFNRLPLRDVDALQDGEIPVVLPGRRHAVTVNVREATQARPYVLSVRVLGHVSDRCSLRVLESD